MNTAAVILAAGKGKRLASDKSKALQPLWSRPLIDHVVLKFKELSSIDKIFVVTSGDKDLALHIGRNFHRVKEVVQKRRLGTADALKKVVPFLKKGFKNILVINVDSPLVEVSTLREMLKIHSRARASLTILVADVSYPGTLGRVSLDRQGVACVREALGLSQEEKKNSLINVGAYVFSRESLSILNSIPKDKKKGEYYLPKAVEILRRRNKRVEYIILKDTREAQGINTRKDLSLAHIMLNEKTIEYHLKKGVTIIDPRTTFIASRVKIGKDTTIYPFSYIEEGVSIGSRCKIGPFCHLRGGSVLKDDCRIGNFTEINRSELGNNVAMKHFGYLGDAEVGNLSNIGAGTVTANYDGKNKHKTRIGKDVFIGSDTVLVAPSVIKEGARTGAGAVVLKNQVVKKGETVAGVPAKVIKDNSKSKRS